MSSTPGFCSVIDYVVDGPDTAAELVDAFAAIQERWVRHYPGYVSSRFHVRADGLRVLNVVRWASEADYRRFEGNTADTKGRLAAIGEALSALSGRARFAAAERYTVVREVGPAHG